MFAALNKGARAYSGTLYGGGSGSSVGGGLLEVKRSQSVGAVVSVAASPASEAKTAADGKQQQGGASEGKQDHREYDLGLVALALAGYSAFG